MTADERDRWQPTSTTGALAMPSHLCTLSASTTARISPPISAPCSPPTHPVAVHRATSPPLAEGGGLGLKLEEDSTCICRWVAAGGYFFGLYSTEYVNEWMVSEDFQLEGLTFYTHECTWCIGEPILPSCSGPPRSPQSAMWIGRRCPEQGTSQTTPQPSARVNGSLPHSSVSLMMLPGRGSPTTAQTTTGAASLPHHGVHRRLLRPFKYAARGGSQLQGPRNPTPAMLRRGRFRPHTSDFIFDTSPTYL
ncbi:uncharacterized protein LOC119297976 isoform X2 [Triticum dicoccoides]|uniref:uncharacterized protein LOC119297976 isoform X2 n=1 Tax=Triticum dicoccoides TaxID=85692 RepID=UPI00188F08E6|nr:uncharacterized protein LOC119297976 isoform X2 [Triticum dicoccoides]XP_044385653.1 uncharacterized protein LOC123107805 isoform X2 [Triticum aestivum]